MSYHRIGFSPEQEAALSVSPEELRALSPKDRAELLLKKRELLTKRRLGFFEALAAFATAAALLGIVGRR